MSEQLELVLPRRVAPQPAPAIVPGGDCGPCCVAGVTGLDVDEAYALAGDTPHAWSWSEMRSALAVAERRDLVAEYIDDVPHWVDHHPAHLLWGPTGAQQSHGWWRYLRLAVGAGFYGLAPIDDQGRGPFEPGDHWVLLCGVRVRYERINEHGGALHEEILISSSARGGSETWMERSRFLCEHGGFAMFLVRPQGSG